MTMRKLDTEDNEGLSWQKRHFFLASIEVLPVPVLPRQWLF
jgi:hypothetical protein